MMIKNERKIAILLSTYNGSKYIEQLLESIISQTVKDFILYIRDDNSTDHTKEIIKDYALSYDNIVLIESDKNLGSKYSFLQMLACIDSEYYMFCDQDDVWKNDKIESTLKELYRRETFSPNIPIIIHTDLTVTDKDLKVIDESYWSLQKMPVDMPRTYKMMCHFNDVTGCTMMFNRSVRDIWEKYRNLSLPKHVYHDLLLSIITLKHGGQIFPLHIQSIFFRRHGDNETNPLLKVQGILLHPERLLVFIQDQISRFKFYRIFGFASFAEFEFYKLYTTYKLRIWKRKLA